MVNIKQQDVKDCGIACLASIGQHYGLHLPLSKIRQWAQTDLQGTNLVGMLHAANQMGFHAKALRGTREQLLQIPLPTIAHGVVDGRLTHFVVICRLHDTYIIVMDPMDGEKRKMSWEAFEKFWTGIVVMLKPNEAFRAYNDQIPLHVRLWTLIRTYRFRLLMSWVAAILYTVLGLIMSLFIQQMTDIIIPQKNMVMLQSDALSMAGILLLQCLLQGYKAHHVLDTGHQLDQGIMRNYFAHIFTLPQRFFDTFRVGEIMSRVSDAVKIRHFVNEVLLEILLNASIVVTAFVVLFVWDARLAWYMSCMIPLHGLVYLLASRWNKRLERNMMEQTAHLENHLIESLGQIRTLKLFLVTEFLKQKTNQLLEKFLGTVLKSNRLIAYSDLLIQVIRSFFTLLLLWKGGELVIQQRLSMGELFALFALYGYFSGPLAQLIQANKAYQAAKIASERFFDVMDMSPDDSGPQNPQTLKTSLSLQRVGFQYGFRKQILNNLSLQIHAGEFTGIVGASGSGKSTIFHLIQKIYTPKTGLITWDGEAIHRLSTARLREKIACVPQDIALFNASISANIALGEQKPDLARIKKIAASIGLDSMVEQFEHGYETMLGENGVAISGGQKQRIAIARALYRNPEIILLDEATSSLDDAAEKQVLNAIQEQVHTVIMISHRMQQFKQADRIHVIDAGTCVESGDHETLMRAGKLYFTWFTKQNAVLV